MTNASNEIVEPVESFEVPDDISELTNGGGEGDGGHDKAPYRTLLEVWRAVLEPARTGEMRAEPISPQWATKMVTTYPGIGFGQVEAIHHGVFDLAGTLAELLDDEIATDDEALKKASAAEDAEENAGHYRYMLAAWQTTLLQEELNWRPSSEDAAVQLAVLSEVQQMFLGETGLVAHLDSIGFQFTDEDRDELGAHLVATRNMVLGVEGE